MLLQVGNPKDHFGEFPLLESAQTLKKRGGVAQESGRNLQFRDTLALKGPEGGFVSHRRMFGLNHEAPYYQFIDKPA